MVCLFVCLYDQIMKSLSPRTLAFSSLCPRAPHIARTQWRVYIYVYMYIHTLFFLLNPFTLIPSRLLNDALLLTLWFDMAAGAVSRNQLGWGGSDRTAWRCVFKRKNILGPIMLCSRKDSREYSQEGQQVTQDWPPEDILTQAVVWTWLEHGQKPTLSGFMCVHLSVLICKTGPIVSTS